MFVLRPLVVAMGACMLQACMSVPLAKEEVAVATPTATPPTNAVEMPPLLIQPVMRVSHSANQSAATFYQLGKFHLERGDLDFARSAYEASITLDAQQLDARNALAALDATQGKLDAAKALLIQIVADFPEVAHPYNNLGYVYYLQSNFEAAERTLRRAIALDAGNERARNNLNAVSIAIARQGNRDTVVLALTQTSSSEQQPLTKTSEPMMVTAAPTVEVTAATEVTATATMETRSQGLAIISPAPELVVERVEPHTRMEVVQIVPNIFELRLKQAVPTFLADLKDKKSEPTSAVADVLATVQPNFSVNSTAKASRIEVANGNGVAGMAKRISNVLGRQGISVSRLSNELPYKQLETKIHYRAGFEKTATNLKNALKGHAVAVLTPNLSANSDIRLVLGKDAITHMALIESTNSDTLLALNTLAD
jgi:Tfp pilus assembly protein PilF